MYSFVVTIKPKSYNSWGSASALKKQQYKFVIEKAFKASYKDHFPLQADLYGLVYHFFRLDTGIDADNLSKPVWDCLKGILYEDDKQVKMRIAGSFDLLTNDLTILDFSGLPGEVIDSLLTATETEDHILYVECGEFTTDMIRLNLERNGD